MKKPLLIAGLLCLACCARAQSDKLPKIRITDGFFSTQIELGDKDVTGKEIRLHLEKTNPEAYHKWRRYESLSNQSAVFTVVCVAGLVGGLLLKNDNAKLASLGGSVVFGGIGLGTALGAASNRKKAVDQYNRSAGY